MLTNEQIDKWTSALRGGEYKQTQSHLRHTDHAGNHSFCCLGVLVDTMGCDWDFEAEITETLDGRLTKLGWGDDAEEYIVDRLIHHSMQGKLSGMNDDEEYSFSQIADYIEENRILFTEED